MNRFLEQTGAQYPIIQAPMGWIARSQLASSVSNAGGLGIIESSSGDAVACREEIEKMGALTDQPFGVNLALRFLADDAMLCYICEESKVKYVTTSAGSPKRWLKPLHDAGIVVYHAVGTVELAMKCVDAGVDGIVVEGAEGGGFKNPEEVSTLVLLQAIGERTDLPLVAAGGIVDGRGMAAAFAAGAAAIQMGTRFVSCAESPVHENFKAAIMDAPTDGTFMLNKKSTPCYRALKTERTAEYFEAGLMEPSEFGNILDLYFGGDMESAIALAGQSAGLIHEVKSAKDIIDETVGEFHKIAGQLGALAASGSF